MAQSIPPPITGIPAPPGFLTIPLVGLVIRITGHLLPLPKPPPESPAFLSATIPLVLHTGIGKKKPPAVGIGTSDHIVHGPPP